MKIEPCLQAPAVKRISKSYACPRSSRGLLPWTGNRTGWSLVTKVALARLSDLAGRNVSEAWAGLESVNADADPPAIWGRLHEAFSDPAGEHRYHSAIERSITRQEASHYEK
jgi:hypothetical protein